MNNMKQFNEKWIMAFNSVKTGIGSSGATENIKRILQEDGAYQIKLLPIPLAFCQSDYENLSSAARRIVSAQRKILASLLKKKSKSEILDFFGLIEELEPYIDWDNILDNQLTISRFDIIPHKNGYAFCEFNYGSPIGGSEEFECFSQYLSCVGLDYNGCVEAPRVTMASLLEETIDDKAIDNVILLVMSEHRYLGYFSLEIFKKHIEEKYPNINVSIEDETTYPEDLLKDFEGEETIVYRVCVEEDVKKHNDFFEKLFNSGATIISGFESEIFMSKKWLSLLHDKKFQSLLNQQELQSIIKYVPFTTSITEGNFDQLMAEKELYVFKSETSFGGKGTIFGVETESVILRETIEKAGCQNWIAQSLVEVDPIELPFKLGESPSRCSSVLGLYLIGEKSNAMNIRVSRSKSVVNVSSDARSGWAFPMSETEKKRLIRLITEKQ